VTLRVLGIVATLLIPAAIDAQTPAGAPAKNTERLAEGAPRPAARVTDFAWLVGRWQGEGLGGAMDEVWSEPAGGSMVGYFRLVRNDKPVFYEIMTLLESEGSVEMRLKHVNPDMTGWEEKADFMKFRLVREDASGAYFEGLTFRRTDKDRIDAYLALRDRTTGVVREEHFVYRRVR
jgi:Domain of unknown function (DUF6265)